MKKILIFLFAIALVSCEDMFLEMPETSGNVGIDEVYSSAKNVEGVLAKCYRDVLIHGWPGGWGASHGALGSISGERNRGYNWHGTYEICEAGLSVNGTTDGADAGADNFARNWMCIRECYVIYENVDRVPNMTEAQKNNIKGEVLGLIAYRYMGMFYRYGGLPLVTKSFTTEDDLSVPRASLQETYDFILDLCDNALALVPENWEPKYMGRIHKGAVLAIKARLQLFAARPLFNSATPYLSNSKTNLLVCFGDYNSSRWNDAITANEAVLTWAAANGYRLLNTGGSAGRPNTNAAVDYGRAVSFPGNEEVILAYKFDNTSLGYDNGLVNYYNASPYNTFNRFDIENSGILTNFLENYYFADGTTPDWPKIGDPEPRPASDWMEKAERMEPRFRVDYICSGVESLSNPGNNNWSLRGWNMKVSNSFQLVESLPVFPGVGYSGKGCGMPTKFYYGAGGRVWFEPPLFRMAEIYLNLAEAYNETGNTAKALENLNLVHNRAGLPAIMETDKDKLRALIQREKAIEMVGENRRYFDAKHWKLPNIGNGVIGGPMRELQFLTDTRSLESNNSNLPAAQVAYWDALTYVAYWNPKMYLEPIPQSEVNKGILVQNPGY